MNAEHVQAVRARIEEIRQRFVDGARPRPAGLKSSADCGRGVFAEALRTAGAKRAAACPGYLEPIVAEAARKYGIGPAVIKAVIRAESGFRPDAVSRVGAQGLMQLMPGTARALGVDPMDPTQNVDGGVRYLRQQLDRFGSLDLALAAYNSGPGNVLKHGGIPPFAETQAYVAQVLGGIEEYR